MRVSRSRTTTFSCPSTSQERVRSVLDYKAFRGVSDHTPLVLEIDV
jgi:hypothetical protein